MTSNERMTGECLTENCVQGSGRGLILLLCRWLSVGTDNKNQIIHALCPLQRFGRGTNGMQD
jgi:hypothetical protein